MTFEEIDAAIAANAKSDIEESFKALVEYPGDGGRIAGATSKRLTETLQAVCDALAANDRIMPGGTFDAIKGNIPDETELAGGSYRDGALAVKANMVRWNAFFARRRD